MKQAHVYRWSNLNTDTPIPLIERRRIIGEKAMISNVVLKAGCFVAAHEHENEQFAILLSGKVRFGLGVEGESDYYEVTLSGGEVLHLPANVRHSAKALEESQILDIFSPPSEKTGIDSQRS